MWLPLAARGENHFPDRVNADRIAQHLRGSDKESHVQFSAAALLAAIKAYRDAYIEAFRKGAPPHDLDAR
jgi:hypothetical protein